jgi:hypothetical protein
MRPHFTRFVQPRLFHRARTRMQDIAIREAE